MADHGTSTRYRDGCRCAECSAHNTQRARELRSRRADVVPIPKPKAIRVSHSPNTIGYNEQAVIEQCRLMPAADQNPSIVAQAVTLAKILDDPALQPMHATTSRQMQALLAGLKGPPKKSRGRLSAVQAMSNYSRKVASSE